uniref:Uncharacterized protein n=1 Tax=viral metagenome TaxID=1070528 RepID=A0A6M3MDZ8_9ZZZZ
MHMKKLNLCGFRVNYGKERNGPYSACIYDNTSNSYFIPIKRIKGCETNDDILLRIGFEVALLTLAEVSPDVDFNGKTQIIDYSDTRKVGDKEEN